MTDKKTIVIFGVVIAAGVSLSLIMGGGYFPVASVNSSFIFSKNLKEVYYSSIYYYGNALRLERKNESVLDIQEIRQEIKRASLDKLVEETLVKNELKNRLGKDLDAVIQKKIGEISATDKLNNAVRILYGLNANEFERLFLVPQAEYEILEGRLTFENTEIKEWLSSAKQEANVTILVPEFFWNSGVKSKN